MAKNTSLKRQAVKYIRDGVKSNYPEKVECAVCSTKEDLELHHYHTVSILFRHWVDKHKHPVSTPEEIMGVRDLFYKEFWDELTVDVVTLCNKHHVQLHSVYGANPALHTTDKQRNWVDLQKRKLSGEYSGSRDTSNLQNRWSEKNYEKVLELWG